MKKSSITWHYRGSDPEWGWVVFFTSFDLRSTFTYVVWVVDSHFQCRQCQDLLENNLAHKRPIEGLSYSWSLNERDIYLMSHLQFLLERRIWKLDRRRLIRWDLTFVIGINGILTPTVFYIGWDRQADSLPKPGRGIYILCWRRQSVFSFFSSPCFIIP